MSGCQYRAQRAKATDRAAAEQNCRDYSRAENGENGGHFGTKPEKVSRVKGAGGAEGEVPTKEAEPDICLVVTEIALQLVNRKAKKKVETIISVNSVQNFGSGEPSRHVKKLMTTIGCSTIVGKKR